MTSYTPQIKGVGEKHWTGNGCRFATEAEALAYAEDLQSRWMGCQGGEANRRAVYSDDPVNYCWNFAAGHAYRLVKPEDVR